MGYTVLRAEDAFWRPSNQMSVLNTDLGKQLGAAELGARFWRLMPGQGSTRHLLYPDGPRALSPKLEGGG
jgi:uncharacterized cupin superfamily protein